MTDCERVSEIKKNKKNRDMLHLMKNIQLTLTYLFVIIKGGRPLKKIHDFRLFLKWIKNTSKTQTSLTSLYR